MPHPNDSLTLETLDPHPVYDPQSPRYRADCACGWRSIPSTFRAFVIGDYDRHTASAHGVALPERAADSLAACWAEAVAR